jgi:hypothetical protein
MPTPNTVKYSSSFVTGTLGLNNMYLGVNDSLTYGPTSTTDFWNGYTPGASGYTIYIRKNSDGPSIYSPSSDSELIDTARRISVSRGESPTLSAVSDAISYLNSKSDMICVNADYPSIVTDGLVLHLDSSFTPSYPKGGTGWKDLSSSSKTATLTNGVSYISSNGGSLDYNSSTLQYVDVPDLGSLNNFTVSCWFKLNTLPTTAGAAALVANVYNGSVLNFSIGLNRSPTSSNICGGFFNGAWRTTNGFTPTTGKWYNTSVTYNGSQIIQYLDGVQQSTLTYTGTPTSSSQGIRIGRRWDSAPNSVDFIDGEIPIVQIYNRALSSSEVLSNYDTLQSRYQNPVSSNLVLYYDPSNIASYSGSGTTITDLSGNGLNGTMSNITFTSPYFTYNGTSSQISVTDNALLEPGSGNWTIEVWVNQSVAGNDVVLGKFDPGGLALDVSYSVRTTSTTYYAQMGSGSGSGSSLYINSSNYVGTIGTWSQIVYVFKNGATKTLETFVNGSSVGTVNHSLASILNTSSNLYIGSYNNGEYSQWFDGKIGITRLYNEALSSSQVLQNFNSDKSKYGL